MVGNSRITVVTALYNSVPYLHRLHESLVNQSFQDFEWIVVDDGSSDGSCEYALSLPAPWSGGTKVFRMPNNTGGPLAYAVGILNASGKIITTVDHDDQLLPQILSDVISNWPRVEAQEDCAGLIYQILNPATGKLIGRPLPVGLYTSFSKLHAYHQDVTDVAGFFRAKLAKRFMSLASMEMVMLGGLPMRMMSGNYSVLYPSTIAARGYHRDNPMSQTNLVRISEKTVYTYARLINSMDRYALVHLSVWVRRAIALTRFSLAIHRRPFYHLRYIDKRLHWLFAATLAPLGVIAWTLFRRKEVIVTYSAVDIDLLTNLIPLGHVTSAVYQ